jgi:hypothetical protein
MVVVVFVSGCGPKIIPGLPPLNDASAVIQTVLNNLPPITEFDSVAGDKQYVSITGTDTIRGRIIPHHKAHTHGLQHGKLLALIHVDKDYSALGVAAGTHYWILATRPAELEVPAGARTDFVNVFVPARGDSITVRPLYINQHDSYTHKQAAARWQVQSDAMPWASCGAHMCCCGGSGCDM